MRAGEGIGGLAGNGEGLAVGRVELFKSGDGRGVTKPGSEKVGIVVGSNQILHDERYFAKSILDRKNDPLAGILQNCTSFRTFLAAFLADFDQILSV